MTARLGLARTISIGLLALLFLTTGTLHFLKSATFASIVPPWLPAPLLLVQISGLCELLGAIGLLIPRLRRGAGSGLIALLIAVFPANLYMALAPSHFANFASPALLWWRLPLQAVLIAWICFAIGLKPQRSDYRRYPQRRE